MRLPYLVSSLLLLTGLAGCASPAATPEAASNAPFTLTSDANECHLVVSALLADPARVQAQLPEGFHAADAQGLLGAPIPTGRAGVLLTAYECDEWTLAAGPLRGAEVNVLIEAPDVTGVTSDADTHYYQLALYVPDSPLVADLVRMGWPVHVGNARSTVESLGLGSSGAGDADDADGRAYHVEAVGEAASTLAGTSRFWSDTPVGVAYWDYTVDASVFVGSALCTMRTGTPAAQIAGDAACDPGDALGIVVPSFSWTSTLIHLPEAVVTV